VIIHKLPFFNDILYIEKITFIAILFRTEPTLNVFEYYQERVCCKYEIILDNDQVLYSS
jgi:hypothetical protein